MTKLPLAIVTMAYNEADFMPLWLKYYSSQVALEHCYVIDHGSTDFSTRTIANLCPVIRVPRQCHDDNQRVWIVGRFCSALLALYDRVLYSDSDEFVVADPARFDGLLDYSKSAPNAVITAFGGDVVHDFLKGEVPLDLQAKILRQRQWFRPHGFLCKPTLINREVNWWTGFHGYDGGSVFGDLFLFHLAYSDKDIAYRRQIKRNQSIPVDGGGHHHAMSPEATIARIKNEYLGLPRSDVSTFAVGDAPREKFIDQLFTRWAARDVSHIKHLEKTPGELWKIPDRFRDVF